MRGAEDYGEDEDSEEEEEEEEEDEEESEGEYLSEDGDNAVLAAAERIRASRRNGSREGSGNDGSRSSLSLRAETVSGWGRVR